MTSEVCYPLSGTELCKRKDVLNKLKILVKEIQSSDGKLPLCRQDSEDDKGPGSKCLCEKHPHKEESFYQPMTMDGQLAKAVLSDNTKRKMWCPPCLKPCPKLEAIHSCYKHEGTEVCKQEMADTVNMTDQKLAENQAVQIQRQGGTGQCCKRTQCTAETCFGRDAGRGLDTEHRFGVCKELTKIERNDKEFFERETGRQDKDYCQHASSGRARKCRGDEGPDPWIIQLGQSCPHEHPPPTMYRSCPQADLRHNHWSPPHTTECMYPNACVASCFLHPDYKDWIYQQPSYRFYLQDRNERPFKDGY